MMFSAQEREMREDVRPGAGDARTALYDLKETLLVLFQTASAEKVFCFAVNDYRGVLALAIRHGLRLEAATGGVLVDVSICHLRIEILDAVARPFSTLKSRTIVVHDLELALLRELCEHQGQRMAAALAPHPEVH